MNNLLIFATGGIVGFFTPKIYQYTIRWAWRIGKTRIHHSHLGFFVLGITIIAALLDAISKQSFNPKLYFFFTGFSLGMLGEHRIKEGTFTS